jgi:hypothetical protein
MQKGDKVRRIHPSYPGSWIEQDKIYTVQDFNDLHLTLEEMDWDHLFLVDAFELVQ